MQYFIIGDNNSWSHSNVSILDALQKCRLTPTTKAGHFAEAIEESLSDDKTNIEAYLKEAQGDWKYIKEENQEHEFWLQIVSDDFELGDVNAVDGSPSWKYKIDNAVWDPVECRLRIKSDGTITFR